MPFSTDASWPEGFLKAFNVTRNIDVPQHRYLALFNKLLYYTFTAGDFSLSSSLQSGPGEMFPLDPTDFVVSYVVITQQQKPVFIVDIKDNRSDRHNTCLKADAQIRQRYDKLLRHCPIPRLYGLSVLDTSLRVYCGHKDTGDITPCMVDRPSADCDLPPDFLEGEWDLDLLSPAGFNKMQEIVAYVKAEVAKIEEH
ncbi:uncharacterized protein EI90DRAFT_2973087 [Cantharellus anzutake]|uniref:uncharacterized protein n=1 Tax=Cantharellus anzutake TaxID=1750568 RepID=UPI001905D219|nr:uncharacterized protein EI90DRAFT_2973087 [Cantharellus anzutake]KAF8330364.1 hypothetical protein EI90DRAFT_2973087 [Cantharellus anzutake]